MTYENTSRATSIIIGLENHNEITKETDNYDSASIIFVVKIYQTSIKVGYQGNFVIPNMYCIAIAKVDIYPLFYQLLSRAMLFFFLSYLYFLIICLSHYQFFAAV